MPECSIDDCSSPVLAWGWCGMHYQRWKKWGDPGVSQLPPRFGLATLHFFVDVGDCWIWRGPRSTKGYGRIGGTQAHRRVYELLVGPLSHDLTLDHLCLNKPCVNPDHLEPVTALENTRRHWFQVWGRRRMTA